MLYTEILQRRAEIQKHFLELGRIFKEIRDNKLYRQLDHQTFDSFLGCPEISFRRSTAYALIRVYEVFVEKLKVNQELLAQVGRAKLQTIIPVVEKNVEEWIYKAKELSRSDLQDEVRVTLGETLGEVVKSKPQDATLASTERHPFLFTPDQYLEFVRDQDCIRCGLDQADAAHLPRTVGAGAKPYAVVPLCRGCHQLYHQDPVKFLVDNRFIIFDYFYSLLVGPKDENAER
jgi:hypothetical protein